MAERPITKGEYAYNELRRRIVEGELQPGDRLMLRPLASDMGVSIVPIRDAILRLQEDRLVVMEAHRGATVAEVTLDEYLTTHNIISWNEILAVMEAVANSTFEEGEELRRLLVVEESTIAEGRLEDGIAVAHQFHETMICSASPRLITLIHDLRQQIAQTSEWTVAPLSIDMDRLAESHREHVEIVEAIESREAERVLATMMRHRDAVQTSIFRRQQRSPVAESEKR